MQSRNELDSSLEESPLLVNRQALSPIHSTINPGKLDQTRFTEIRQMESEGSPLRIILIIVAVIIVGGGAIFLVRNLVSNQSNNTSSTDNTVSSPQTQTQQSSLIISKTVSADTTVINLAKKEDYVDSTLVTLGNSTSDSSNMSLDTIYYTKFTTFVRLTFNLTTSDKKLPKTTMNFDSVGNKMTVAFTGLQNIAADLKQDSTISDLVSEIRFVATNNSYVIMLSDKVKYRMLADGDNLIIDIKTLTELAKPDTTTSTTTTDTTTPTTPTTPTSDKPAAPHYDNDYSQDKQYVTSTLTTNSIADNVYYFDNNGSSFEFSWAQKNAIGDSYVPNTTAYYDTSTAGKIYLIVEISNLSQDVLTANGVTGLSAEDIHNRTGASTTGTNFNRIDLISFNGGVAKYRLDLQQKTDYKLWVDKTGDNATGTISVTIKN